MNEVPERMADEPSSFVPNFNVDFSEAEAITARIARHFENREHRDRVTVPAPVATEVMNEASK